MRLTEHMRGPDCLSRLGCDQLLSGELEDRDDLRRHCASCERCAALLASHRQERASFAATLRRPRRHRRWVAGLATAAAALGLWFVVARDRGEESGTRSKGKPAISYYWKHGDVTRKGGLGEIVFPGDAINFTASRGSVPFQNSLTDSLLLETATCCQSPGLMGAEGVVTLNH